LLKEILQLVPGKKDLSVLTRDTFSLRPKQQQEKGNNPNGPK